MSHPNSLTSWHIINLIKLGLYLIEVRPIVDEINLHIKNEKEKAIEVPADVEPIVKSI